MGSPTEGRMSLRLVGGPFDGESIQVPDTAQVGDVWNLPSPIRDDFYRQPTSYEKSYIVVKYKISEGQRAYYKA